MQFRVISADEADRFDQFMQSTPNGHIFQSYLWGEVKRPVWEPLRVVLEEEGHIVAAASVLKRRLPFMGKTFFYL
ncbi:MAG TPA: methicillin resistance protein, partial [Bacillota bacterium]|nr:methicillin resistance protein [Bacillota bacterium]